jgi:hypothetical protein
MENIMIFRRSPEGQQALDNRDKRLAARMRALMLMAEGKPLAQFEEMAQALGAPSDALNQLQALGFVKVTDAAPADVTGVADGVAVDADTYENFRVASGLLRELAADTMGLKAFFFILKVEKASTMQDLAQLVPGLMPGIVKQRGMENAAKLQTQLNSMFEFSDPNTTG